MRGRRPVPDLNNVESINSGTDSTPDTKNSMRAQDGATRLDRTEALICNFACPPESAAGSAAKRCDKA